jgi:catechol 2,3-dioxygenase-like lactoylglutathione lyase family enzyme
MAKLRCLTISASEPDRLADFYRRVFELSTVSEEGTNVVLSDGVFSLAFMKGSDNARPGLHATRFRVEDLRALREKIEREIGKQASFGGEGELSDPDGNRAELTEEEMGAACDPTPFPIRHIAIYTPDPRRLAGFYGGLLQMKEVAYSDRSSIFVSDGYFNLALLYERPGEEKSGLNHFGFHVKDLEEMRDRAERAGVPRGDKRPDRIPFAEYRLHDPEGNGIDISIKGWKV